MTNLRVGVLGADTKSGNLIRQAFTEHENKFTYYTNLVKCLPLSNNKIRYPSRSEMQACFTNLENEIDTLKPNKVVLLGKKVSSFVTNQLKINMMQMSSNLSYSLGSNCGIDYLEVYHPSYVSIYKRKYTEEYTRLLSGFANATVCTNEVSDDRRKRDKVTY